MERNAQEVREEREEAERQKAAATKAAQDEADAATKAQADAAATKAQADAAAKERADMATKVQEAEVARNRAPLLVVPLRSAPPAPETPTPTGGGGDDLPDYHNIRAAAYNSQVRELAKRTADLSDSRRANATVQQQLGEAQTVLRAKEEECSKAAQERDRLVKELADQADQHKAELQKLKEAEDSLMAEFETQCSNWVEREKALANSYSKIEDMLDEYFPGHAVAASQAIEAHRDERRLAGAEITPNAPRTLSEQLLAVQARLQPAHWAFRRLQRVRAQVVSALWPGTPVLRTPSRTADWLEVAVGRFEAWKGSVARASARRAFEFVKAWYPGLSLAQLATFRLEASEELAAVAPVLYHRAAAIAEYTDTSVFLPELDEEGAEVPPNWFGLILVDGEDSFHPLGVYSNSGECWPRALCYVN
nr:uncharacterized protein LOC109764369 [Aegilops tauschii subsp. strangulata]